METVEILITEGKSSTNIGKGLVRVFIDRDYNYGYFVPEDILYGVLTTSQQKEYFECNKFKVIKDAANHIIENGQTPYTKRFIK